MAGAFEIDYCCDLQSGKLEMIILDSVFERSLHHWKEIPFGLLRGKEVVSVLVQQKSESNFV